MNCGINCYKKRRRNLKIHKNGSNMKTHVALPGNTFNGLFFSRIITKVLAVMLKICRGVKFTPSLTWKLKPPDIAPKNTQKKNIISGL